MDIEIPTARPTVGPTVGPPLRMPLQGRVGRGNGQGGHNNAMDKGALKGEALELLKGP